MIFKHMSLEEAKELYKKLKEEESNTLVKIAMDDIWFFYRWIAERLWR